MSYSKTLVGWEIVLLGLGRIVTYYTGWWFGTFFPNVGNVIIPTDEHIFQRGRSTTNQYKPDLQGCRSMEVSCLSSALRLHIYPLDMSK